MTVLALLRCMSKTAFGAAIYPPFMPTNLGTVITAGCIAKTCGNVQVPAFPSWDFGSCADHVLPQKCGWTWLQLYHLPPTSVLNASAYLCSHSCQDFPQCFNGTSAPSSGREHCLDMFQKARRRPRPEGARVEADGPLSQWQTYVLITYLLL